MKKRRHPAVPLSHLLLLSALLIGCAAASPEEPVEPADSSSPNPVFPGSSLISISQPQSGETTTTTPSFAWTATGRRLVFVGIFNENLSIRDGRIANPESNVWAWHSGLGTGREGSIFFTDGRDVVSGELQVDSAPTPLATGKSYVWAVWAWDSGGKEITHSSPEILFQVP